MSNADSPTAPGPDGAFDVAGFLDQSADVFVVYDTGLRYTAINRVGASLLGRAPGDVIGKTNAELIGPGAAAIEPHLRECFATQAKVFVLHEIPTNDGLRYFDTIYTPIRGADGGVRQVFGICRDVTDDRLRWQRLQAMVDAQAQALKQLSTPLLHVREGIVFVPLIGALDDRRAGQLVEVLLSGVADFRARVAILDITGVPNIDERVANALVNGAKAVRLLGARVILTGISPKVAQLLVALNIALEGITTHGSLQQGFAEAFGP